LSNDVNGGLSLAQSMKRYRHIFGEFFISIVEVGEASGTLADNLLYLAEEMKKNKELRSKVRSAMIYPLILLIMTLAISGFLTFFIFPKILPTFTNFNVELPASTRILIATLTFLQVYWWAILIGIIVFSITWKLLLRLNSFKYIVHKIFLSTPVLSRLTIDINMANFTRILSILLKSGVRIVEAVIIVSNTFENRVYRRSLLEAAEDIRKGGAFSEHLLKEKRYFPTLLASMIEVGENTGNLEENLRYLSQYYSDEVDGSLKNLTTLLEPLILLLMGLIVGFVALSIITPIYTISQGIAN